MPEHVARPIVVHGPVAAGLETRQDALDKQQALVVKIGSCLFHTVTDHTRSF